MKLLLLTAALLTLGLSTGSSPVCAQSSGCGIKPIKPIPVIGCSDLEAVCSCDERGKNCRWTWVCVKRR